MGYSGRYHAASLAAVFIALAIGILIGIGLANDVVSSASKELESSLRSDLADAQARRDELQSMLDRERDFSSRVYPALVSGRLAGSSVAIVGVGGLPENTVSDVEAALDPAGASVDAVAVVATPPDRDALAEAAPARFRPARRGGAGLERLGRAAGAGVAGGSRLLETLRGTLFSRFSGSLDEVDDVVFVGTGTEDQKPKQKADTEALLKGVLDGVRRSGAGVVAVERTDTEPTTLGPYSAAGIATADHVDLTAGRVALVFALLGAGGDYGTKQGADSFLPELISPAPRLRGGPPATGP